MVDLFFFMLEVPKLLHSWLLLLQQEPPK